MKKFSIVQFKDNGIHLIPTSYITWIYNDNEKCYWPSYYKRQNKNNQAICNEECPDNDKWSSYEILKIFDTTDSYTDGLRKVKLAEEIFNIESGKNDTDHEKNKSRYNWVKRKFTSDDEKKDSETQDFENEDSEEKSRTTQEICKKGACEIPPLPTLPSVRKETTTQMLKKKNKIADDNRLETKKKSNIHIINSSLYDFNKSNMKESPTSGMQSDISYLREQSASSSCKTDFQTEVLCKLNTIIYQVKMMDKRMKMHEEQCHFNLNRDDILQDEEIELPLHDELALHMLEQKLENKEFFESMVCTLKGLGGFTVHSCTVNLLKTNPLAEMYSMAGAGVKKKKAFQDLILYKIIIKTIRVHYKDATETEITGIIARWLVQAKYRRERKERRNIYLKMERDQLRKETGSSNESFYFFN